MRENAKRLPDDDVVMHLRGEQSGLEDSHRSHESKNCGNPDGYSDDVDPWNWPVEYGHDDGRRRIGRIRRCGRRSGFWWWSFRGGSASHRKHPRPTKFLLLLVAPSRIPPFGFPLAIQMILSLNLSTSPPSIPVTLTLPRCRMLPLIQLESIASRSWMRITRWTSVPNWTHQPVALL